MKKTRWDILDIIVSFALGFLFGILVMTISSHSSEVAAKPAAAFNNQVDNSSHKPMGPGILPSSSLRAAWPYQLSRGTVVATDLSHKQVYAGSNPAPAIPNNRVRLGLREAPPTHHPNGLHKNQSGLALSIIKKAAERNNCYGDDFLILRAIRKQENGREGCEFGVEKVWDTDLETQAAWAAATIVKSRGRWEKAGKPNNFIAHLSKEYCPLDCFIWERNVRYWFEKFKCTR